MSGISALSTTSAAQLLGTVSAATETNAAATSVLTDVGTAGITTAASATTTQVTLGSSSALSLTYDKPVVLNSSRLAWASESNDDLSTLLGANLQAASTGSPATLLKGLGALLINQVGSGQDYRQSVAAYSSTDASSKTAATGALQQVQNAANTVSLSLRTVSGKQVNISIAFGSGDDGLAKGLSVQVHTDGKLTADEQAAIAKLSDGFEKTLKSIGNADSGDGSGAVDLSGLVGFDTTQLASVDLNFRASAKSPLTSVDFHADLTSRKFSMSGLTGQVSLAVDLSNPATWGSEDQRQQSIAKYLSQFDAANQRAQSNGKLMLQFKTAFSQLQSAYPPKSLSGINQATTPNSREISLLTGLADFKAQIGGDFDDSGPGKVTTMAGHMDYRVSQSTVIRGLGRDTSYSLGQDQGTGLTSDYVRSRNGAMLDTSTGNYDVFHVRDESSISVSIAYADGKLLSATVTSSVQQFLEYIKLVDHKAEDKKQTPSNSLSVDDVSGRLLSLLSPTTDGQSSATAA
jgi:hypothetical protein